jgi:Tol biopolymer transport system component
VFDLASGTDSVLVSSNHEWGVTSAWSKQAGAILFSPITEGRGLDSRYITMTGTRTMKDYLATEANEGVPALSPDGQWIAYWSDASGTFDLVVDRFPVPSGARRVQTGAAASMGGSLWGCQVWWSADGRSLVFYRPDEDEVRAVDVRTGPSLSLGEPRMLVRLPADRYGIDHDAPRGRVLVATPVGTPRSSLIVIQNWQRQLESVN